MNQKKSLIKRILGHPFIVIFFLITFPPIGIFLMFLFSDWSNGVKMALAVICTLIFISSVVMTMNEIAAEEAAKQLMYAIKETM